MTNLYVKVAFLISKFTSDSPITGKEIAERLGMKGRASGKEGADVRNIINNLRREGYPICANGKGYYWPKSGKELQDYIDSFQQRIDRQVEACMGMKEGMDKAGKEIVVRKVPTLFSVTTDLFGKEIKEPVKYEFKIFCK